MDALMERLSQPASELRWRLASEEVAGEAVLAVAQSGLELQIGPERWEPVPRVVWHTWVGEIATRAARAALGGPLTPAEHELSWIQTALTLVFALGAPDDALEASIEELPGGLLGLSATLNTIVMMMSLQSSVGHRGFEIARDAFTWAARARTHSRRCPHAPCTLAARAADLHGELAAARGGDAEAAAAEERATQLDALPRLWRSRRDNETSPEPS